MTRVRPFSRSSLLVPAFFAVYAATLLVWLVVPSLYLPQRPFEPYVTVLTELDHDRAAAELLQAGARDVITPATTGVAISRFSRVETVSLDTALDTLDPLDPRRDPWVEGLSEYFRVGERNAVYASFDAPLARTDRIVRRALGPHSRVAEWSPLRTAGALALFAAVAVFAAIAYGGRRTIVGVIATPFLPAVVTAGLPGAAAAGALVLLFAWSAEEIARLRATGGRDGVPVRIARVRAAVTAAALALSLVYLGRLAGLLRVVPLAVAAAGAAAGLAAVLVRSGRRSDPEHRPFVPVSIIARSSVDVVGRSWVRLVLAALPLLLVLPPVLDAVVPGGAGARPVAEPAGDLGYDTLRSLWYGQQRRSLPDLADYLAHRAYQEGLAYGRSYAFPERSEAVELTRYRERPDGSYSAYSEAVLVYDDAWMSAALESAPAGIARMLVGTGIAAGVVLSPSDTIYSGYSQFLQHLAYVVLVLAPFLLAALPWARTVRTRDPIVELARRRRQVA